MRPEKWPREFELQLGGVVVWWAPVKLSNVCRCDPSSPPAVAAVADCTKNAEDNSCNSEAMVTNEKSRCLHTRPATTLTKLQTVVLKSGLVRPPTN